MRVLIYSETPKAKEVLAQLREEGHHASLRNPQYFNAAEMETADEIVVSANDNEIFKAYSEAEISVKYLENFGAEPEATTAAVKPKRKK